MRHLIFSYSPAVLLGMAITFAHAPFSLWFISPIAIAGLIALLHHRIGNDEQATAKENAKQAVKLGFAFGLGWFGAGVSWVHVSIAQFGGLPLIGSLGLMALLCSYLALYPALAFGILARFFKPKLWPLALPLIWLFCEWLRSWLLTGFPWLSLGYSQIHGPLAGWLPIVGEVGLSGLMLLACAALSVNLKQSIHRAMFVPRLVPAFLPLSVLLVGGYVLNQQSWFTHKSQLVNIAMVQGNIAQALRWVPEQDAPTMQKYLDLSQAHWHNDLVIWPEAAIPKIEPLAQDYLHRLDQQALDTNTGLITGIVNYNFETREAFNNLLSLGRKDAELGSEQTLGQYRYQHPNRFAKHHLLPIGEFIPMEDWLRGLAPIFDLPMSSFTRGDYQQANLLTNGYRLAPALCFEIAFPRQISANITTETDFIITVSNDAWFGDSHGPAQHLEIAQVRAKEFGLPVLRATNNGITAFVNPDGSIHSRLPQFEAGVLEATIDLVASQTPYRHLGDLSIYLLSLFLFAVAVRLRKV